MTKHFQLVVRQLSYESTWHFEFSESHRATPGQSVPRPASDHGGMMKTRTILVNLLLDYLRTCEPVVAQVSDQIRPMTR